VEVVEVEWVDMEMRGVKRLVVWVEVVKIEFVALSN